jgi:hypothetical protein
MIATSEPKTEEFYQGLIQRLDVVLEKLRAARATSQVRDIDGLPLNAFGDAYPLTLPSHQSEGHGFGLAGNAK